MTIEVATSFDTIQSDHEQLKKSMSYIFKTPRGKSTVLHLDQDTSYESFLWAVLEKSATIDQDEELHNIFPVMGVNSSRRKINDYHGRMVKRTCNFTECSTDNETRVEEAKAMDIDGENINVSQLAFVVHDGKVLDKKKYLQFIAAHSKSPDKWSPHHISLHLRLRGGVDRQNRVGSKFGGGGVSSAQQSERERKERLRQLALETVDLAKDPYLMRNHLGTYECKLCLTLHTNEGYVK